MSESEKCRVQLTLHAENIKNVARFVRGTPDPYAVVTLLSSQVKQKPLVLGRTECVRNSLSPRWVKQFFLEYSFGNPVYINIGIYDVNRKSVDKPMGSATFEIGDVLGSRSKCIGKKMKEGGIVYARVQQAKDVASGICVLRFSASNLKNVEGIFKGKSDPFFEISRLIGSHNQLIYRSEFFRNNLNPIWEFATIDLDYLCDGELDKTIFFDVFDWEKSGNHQSMGGFQTTVKELIEAQSSNNTYSLIKGEENYGFINVLIANLEKDGEALSIDEYLKKKDSNDRKAFNKRSSFIEGRAKTYIHNYDFKTKVPTIVDYISSNCELELCVAIDFTASNGNPSVPGTYHHVNKNGEMNDYEKAITAVASIVAKYDHDQKFPVWGFGAKYNGEMQQCFQVGPEPEAQGVCGILESYRSVFKTPIVMSGPADFSHVIKHAAATAKNSLGSSLVNNMLSYTFLLILTSGNVSYLTDMMNALDDASSAPLSIIIVGIGNADFKEMQFLDDFAKGDTRDICQFVNFEAHKHSKLSLAKATMEEVPGQLVEFFTSNGLYPNTDIEMKTQLSVSDFDNTDVHLNLQFEDNGDINFSNQEGTQINNEYAFKVEVPEGATPGTHLEVESPFSGKMLQLVVPENVSPGEIFIVYG